MLLKWGNKAYMLIRKEGSISIIWGLGATYAINKTSSTAYWVRTRASLQKLSSHRTIENVTSLL